ncbi:hypothetical protein AK812_SmicGene14255 [Symbiodinium microadriaticum]|uniref:K Homology domain-containing protein n=1 Tax=Symbiodinium microadriaticum TaxID=2951 RepID=A0A1Q9E5Z8_SYMMI|nr:hypothetical protein AK812_SmicGene14255 [Symbiodinium microadriaticum]
MFDWCSLHPGLEIAAHVRCAAPFTEVTSAGQQTSTWRVQDPGAVAPRYTSGGGAGASVPAPHPPGAITCSFIPLQEESVLLLTAHPQSGPRRSPRSGANKRWSRSPSRRRQRVKSASRSRSHGRLDEGDAPSRIFVAHADCAKIIGRKGEIMSRTCFELEAMFSMQTLGVCLFYGSISRY